SVGTRIISSAYQDVYNDKGSAWECIPGGSASSYRNSILSVSVKLQEAEPPRLHSQAEPGNEKTQLNWRIGLKPQPNVSTVNVNFMTTSNHKSFP
ncbi:hypothetical protein MHK_004667, partial [Candidatus Magnetomorum sp. HK-1]